MRLTVRVPVLSVQITVVQPSVSTESRFLTSALLSAHTPGSYGEAESYRGKESFRDIGNNDPDGEDEGCDHRVVTKEETS